MGMYKTLRHIFLPLLLILAFLMSGCVDDTLDMTTPSRQKGDTEYFLKLRLKTSTGAFSTRAGDNNMPGDLVNGTHDEHAIGENGNFAIFFDEEDAYISCAELYSINEYGGGQEGSEEPPVTQTESEYTTRFYGFANRKPAKVLVVVNASDKVKNKVMEFPGWNLKEVMKQVWEETGYYRLGATKDPVRPDDPADPYGRLGFRKEGNVKYFTMTNASYIEHNPEDNTGRLHCAEIIKDENVTDNEEEIIKLKPVTVYLERMVSKFEFAMTNTESNTFLPYNAQSLDVCIYTDGQFKYHDYKWAVEVVGWGINGLERSNYLFKNLDPEGQYLKDYPEWNSAYDRRSWWSEDPHYYKSEGLYPWQTRAAKDMVNPDNINFRTLFQYYSDPNPEHRFSLTYYPYSWFIFGNDESSYDDVHLFNPLTGEPDFGNYRGTDKVVYAPENTFSPGMIVDRSQNAGDNVYTRAAELAGTHLLLACRLKYDDSGTNNYKYFEGNNAHLYRNRVGVSYIEEVSMFEDFMNAVNFKLESQQYLYYRYYEWGAQGNNRNAIPGNVVRAKSGGHYSLYYYNKRENEFRELTYVELQRIRDRAVEGYTPTEDGEYPRAYKLTVDAYTQNGDGKVLPWICYRSGIDEAYEELELVIIGVPDVSDPDYSKYCHIDSETGSEVIGRGNFTEQEVRSYVSKRKLNFQEYDGVWEENSGDGWKDLSELNKSRDNNDLKSLFYEIWGVAEHFYYGMMYYAIPIHALDRYNNYAKTSSVIADPDYYTSEEPYYYGNIRNNWYKFTLRSINDLGIPVSDPYQDIVPNYTRKLDQLKVEMEILQWHLEDIEVPID